MLGNEEEPGHAGDGNPIGRMIRGFRVGDASCDGSSKVLSPVNVTCGVSCWMDAGTVGGGTVGFWIKPQTLQKRASTEIRVPHL